MHGPSQPKVRTDALHASAKCIKVRAAYNASTKVSHSASKQRVEVQCIRNDTSKCRPRHADGTKRQPQLANVSAKALSGKGQGVVDKGILEQLHQAKL